MLRVEGKRDAHRERKGKSFRLGMYVSPEVGYVSIESFNGCSYYYANGTRVLGLGLGHCRPELEKQSGEFPQLEPGRRRRRTYFGLIRREALGCGRCVFFD